MGVKITQWRCSNGRCNGSLLASVVDIEAGWIERKCRRCGKVSHVGVERGNEAAVDLKCKPGKQHRHTLAQASTNWRGRISITCDRCKTESTITPDSP